MKAACAESWQDAEGRPCTSFELALGAAATRLECLCCWQVMDVIHLVLGHRVALVLPAPLWPRRLRMLMYFSSSLSLHSEGEESPSLPESLSESRRTLVKLASFDRQRPASA